MDYRELAEIIAANEQGFAEWMAERAGLGGLTAPALAERCGVSRSTGYALLSAPATVKCATVARALAAIENAIDARASDAQANEAKGLFSKFRKF